MDDIKLHIKDELFVHAHSSSGWNKPKTFSWIRQLSGELEHLILTDNEVFKINIYRRKYENVKIYAWLIESPAIKPTSYEFVINNADKFDKIFTFHNTILKKSPNSELIPIGGCWINESDHLIYNKIKNVSMIMSNKMLTVGHMLRHEIKNKFLNVDYYGRGIKQIPNKIDGLKDYRFSIAIENVKEDFYFTEKLIDCIVTGTIPIYWGCPSIGKFFNEKGIITFNNVNELYYIFRQIEENGQQLYDSKISYIKQNYELAKEYLIADDIIYKKIKEKNEI